MTERLSYVQCVGFPPRRYEVITIKIELSYDGFLALARFPRIRVGFFFARRARSAVSARDWGGIFNRRSNSLSRRWSSSFP